MKTVGKQLQDARTAKGWSPEMAARETKIRLDRLRELEDDDYSNFSSPTYARGFVRTYARALGLDEYRVLRQLDNKLPEDDNATFVNDTGVPYMPEPGQVSKPFQVGRGVYIAGGIGLGMLLIIGFILVQSYRAGYFATAAPPPAALPVTATNALPAVPDTETARALPADTNAAPVPVPVDLPPASVATTPPAPASILADTNGAPRALPVDLNAIAATTNAAPVVPAAANPAAAPAVVATAPATAPAATDLTTAPATGPVPSTSNPAAIASNPPVANATDATTNAPTVSIATSTPPRALPVDLNALGTPDATNAPMADASSASASAPATDQPAAHSLSARDSNSGPGNVHLAAAEKATQDLIAATTPPPAANSADAPATESAPVALPLNAPIQQAPSDPVPVAQPAPLADQAAVAPSSPAPAPATDAAETGSTPAASTPPPAAGDTFHGSRLVLTASHDSFVRVIALDGPDAGQVRYSSMLHSGQSISFNDHKYSINVGDPSAVDIALDGINYGPHSDNSSPDTFTVESHIP